MGPYQLPFLFCLVLVTESSVSHMPGKHPGTRLRSQSYLGIPLCAVCVHRVCCVSRITGRGWQWLCVCATSPALSLEPGSPSPRLGSPLQSPYRAPRQRGSQAGATTGGSTSRLCALLLEFLNKCRKTEPGVFSTDVSKFKYRTYQNKKFENLGSKASTKTAFFSYMFQDFKNA